MNIFDASEEARNILLQREKRQAVYFITEFRKIQERLKIQIDQTLIEIEKGRLAGEISPALISTNLRLNNLLNAITAEIDTLSRPFARHIADGQAAAIDTAKETARKVLPPEITASFQVFDAEATKQLIGIAGNGQPLFTLFEKLGTPVRQAVFDALFYGMATGAANQTIARDIREAVGTGAVNAMTIARTETNRAYREASREFYDATPAVIGWRWMSARDLTTCPVCWSMHGRVFPTSTKFGSHPNCLLPGALINSPGTVGAAKRRYIGQTVEIVTAFGCRLAVTANHPIMRPNGWVAANLLNEGDYIITAIDGQRAMSVVSPNDDNKPTVIDKVFKTLNESSGVFSRHMEVSAEDFHGDGFGGNVNIVFSDGLLRNSFNSTFMQPVIESDFVNRIDAAGLFPRFCSAHELAWLSGLPANGFLGGSGIRDVVGLTSSAHHQNIRSFDSTNWDTFTFQNPINRRPGNPEFVCDEVLRLPGGVEFDDLFRVDRIVFIRHNYYEGNVYNAETSTGYYVANGIVSSNCRCVSVPVFVDSAPVETGSNLFGKLTPAQQKAILGPRRFDLYGQGARLRDFVETYESPFGIGRRVKTLENTTFKPRLSAPASS